MQRGLQAIAQQWKNDVRVSLRGHTKGIERESPIINAGTDPYTHAQAHTYAHIETLAREHTHTHEHTHEHTHPHKAVNSKLQEPEEVPIQLSVLILQLQLLLPLLPILQGKAEVVLNTEVDYIRQKAMRSTRGVVHDSSCDTSRPDTVPHTPEPAN